ncbi:MAG: DHA2 family efflux MFS transporter permease subunit [Bauldia sp.]|nr:DHA2 family efflux MFS transporter permease subunit [Bauldia sp.]
MSEAAASSGVHPHATHKGIILLVLGISQLMIILDATIVNTALPSIQVALGVQSYGDLQWIVTGYTLAFGGFLLLGGKLADRIGRRLVFTIGAGLFGLASLAGGFANDLGLLIAARALQGLGGALMAPAALSLLTVVFEEGRERDRAFGVWAAISAGGAALGLILGGVLTEWASWRWVLFVNTPIALFAVWGVLRYVPESRDENARGFDFVGAVLATAGLAALVYGLVNANDVGWGSAQTLLTLAGSAVLLVAFVLLQQRLRSPLLPLSLFRSRWVTGANLGGFLIACGLFSVFYFVVLWMQQINGWTPIQSGFGALPITAFIVVGAGIASVMLNRVGPRPLATIGPFIAAAGLLYIGISLEPDSRYVSDILPGFILLATGMGLGFVALTSAAVSGIPQENAGSASAVLNASQQIGGSVGLAVLLAVAIGVTNANLPEGVPFDPAATVQGWGTGLMVGAGLIALAGIVMFLILPNGRPTTRPGAMAL